MQQRNVERVEFQFRFVNFIGLLLPSCAVKGVSRTANESYPASDIERNFYHRNSRRSGPILLCFRLCQATLDRKSAAMAEDGGQPGPWELATGDRKLS